MTPSTRPCLRLALRLVIGAALTSLAGCGFDRLQAPLPDAVPGFSLPDLEEIQNDDSLTDDQKRERIREAVGAPDNASGDRLVEFLLNFDVP